MIGAGALSEVSRLAADERSSPQQIKDAVLAAVTELLRDRLVTTDVSEPPSVPRPVAQPDVSTRKVIDVAGKYQVILSLGAPLTGEQESWLFVLKNILGLWAQARRIQAYNRFATGAVDRLRQSSPDASVVSRLELVAELATEVRYVKGAVAVALDGDGQAAAFGASGVEIPSRDVLSPLMRGRLASLDPHRDKSIDLGEEGQSIGGGLPVHAYPMFIGDERDGKHVGFLFASIKEGRSEQADTLLVPFARLANWVLRDALQGEAVSRLRRLQDLLSTHKELTPPDIVKALADIFRADVVSLFLDDHGALRLAASTDKDLARGGADVSYRPGENITGWIFLHGQPKRFFDLNAAADFRRDHCNAKEPKHREHAAGESTTRLVAVPLRWGKTIVGVLRMSRAQNQHHFTQGEQDALCFFGDVLGALLSQRWEEQVSTAIQELTADAVYLARDPEERDGLESPIVVEREGAGRLYGRDTLLGVNASSLYSTKRVIGVTQSARKEGGRAGPIETFATLPNKERRPIELSMRLLSNELFSPPTRYWLVLARDISERKKRTEEIMRQDEFLKHVKIAYFRCDPAGMTPNPTPLDCEITGYSAEELATTSRVVLYEDPKDREHLIEEVGRAPGRRLLRKLVRLKRKNNEKIVVEADLRLVYDERGRYSFLEGFYREVTDRLMLQSFLDADDQRLLTEGELFARLKTTATFQQDYLLSLGHQLRAPLVALIRTLQNFDRRIIRADLAAERMRYAIGQTRACIDMVENLSFLGRILRNEPLSKKEVQLARMVIHVKLDMSHLIRDKWLELTIDDKSLDEVSPVWADPGVLRQVFVNLLDNAIKYSYPQTQIKIVGRKYRAGYLAIDVINEGLEIPFDLRTEIFKRGYRTRQAEALIPHGTGLGLWLVLRMLSLHEARIECVSEPLGHGRARNCFRIIFPRPS